jgi:hypothetical protein
MWLKQSSNQEGPNALKMSTDAVIPSSSPSKTEMGGMHRRKKKKEKKKKERNATNKQQ